VEKISQLFRRPTLNLTTKTRYRVKDRCEGTRVCCDKVNCDAKAERRNVRVAGLSKVTTLLNQTRDTSQFVLLRVPLYVCLFVCVLQWETETVQVPVAI